MSNFYIVATPIGNLEDITKRALRILSEVDLILCEDTRTTKKLLDFYQIKTPTLSYHQHSKLKKIEHIVQLLQSGKKIALVSDAGTPGISDPGNKLVEKIVDSTKDNVRIISVPGASALTAAAGISGFPTDKFLFLGFPPAKKKRKKFFEEVANSKYSVIFYESARRIIRTLNELQLTAESKNLEIEVVVCRELTKKFETTYRGGIKNVIKKIEEDKIKGEFAVVAKKK